MSEIKPTMEQLQDPYVLQLIETISRLQESIEELEAELKATQENEYRLAEANKPLLARACKAEAENERLRGDLEVMRLQRDATHVSRCPNCERLRAVYEAVKDIKWRSIDKDNMEFATTCWKKDAITKALTVLKEHCDE